MDIFLKNSNILPVCLTRKLDKYTYKSNELRKNVILTEYKLKYKL